jgi:hypothetical protein
VDAEVDGLAAGRAGDLQLLHLRPAEAKDRTRHEHDHRGVCRRLGAPAILLGVFVVTLLIALPAGQMLEGDIAGSLGRSFDADQMAVGVNGEWWERFGQETSGLDSTFTPSVIGFAVVVDNLSRFIDNGSLPAPVVGLVAASLLIWLFLVGGILDRYARRRPLRAQAFFGACGMFFFRFLRLAVIAAIGYGALFGLVHGWLFDRFYTWAVRDVTVERTAVLLRVGLYAVFLGLAAFWNIVMDYAKIRAVVEDRRSMLGAFLAGWRFVVGHPLKTGGLYLLNAVAFFVVLLLYARVAPGAEGSGWVVFAGFAAGQAYVLARLAVKLVFYASQISLFQQSLAHVGYTAAPELLWPESPAAEAIANAAPKSGPSPV